MAEDRLTRERKIAIALRWLFWRRAKIWANLMTDRHDNFTYDTHEGRLWKRSTRRGYSPEGYNDFIMHNKAEAEAALIDRRIAEGERKWMK